MVHKLFSVFITFYLDTTIDDHNELYMYTKWTKQKMWLLSS